jgi:hypothetical protein
MQNVNSMTNKSFKKTLHDKWKRFWSEYQTKNKRRNCVDWRHKFSKNV